ncbi:Recombination protein MgsA [Caminicella sporogenes DSM 14501]|uniref:Replication-associated recombination protein A n=1 Tax=Caminicella sporogenes DSM 14501 TaxID=1121266 RepID=A0A1M6LRP8_9FIRM|nr:replication-associated recombination protein A [Caminicella sporogenes]RKD27926.1 AAA family ATPase [Caminicella sporogenes]SHJ73841.1 Recombination protein MgsA [Caminicella sporogenes DSM 14501]
MNNKPLAERIRPEKLEDVFGQEHILGRGRILNRILKSGRITNMIFYGPPGVGKTTVANIIANMTNKRFYKLNATNASVKDVKNIIDELDTLFSVDGVLLYLDEIQNFNKKQQQSLLEFIETGKITLIASTTENPYHYIYKAILSRSTIFEFKLLNKSNIIDGLKRAIKIVESELKDKNIKIDEEALEYIANVSNGDLRKALNALEIAIFSTNLDERGIIHIDLNTAYDCTQKKILNFDKFGDNYYDILSAFQKSIRGSDPDAAIHYLARLIKAGDLISICRRLLVTASEDIGLAYPNAISIVKACVDTALQVGLPEARIPLAEATLLLSTAPKSNSVIKAIDAALYDIETKDIGDIPAYLKDAHYFGASKLGRGIGYKYPHDYDNNYIKQQYLPDNIKDVKYYIPGKNKLEEKIKSYINRLKGSEL